MHSEKMILRILIMAVVAALALISPALGAEQLAQTPGPDLAWQHAVMQSEAFIISENSCIPTSRRARAGLTQMLRS